jgi:hypothetical protein
MTPLKKYKIKSLNTEMTTGRGKTKGKVKGNISWTEEAKAVESKPKERAHSRTHIFHTFVRLLQALIKPELPPQHNYTPRSTPALILPASGRAAHLPILYQYRDIDIYGPLTAGPPAKIITRRQTIPSWVSNQCWFVTVGQHNPQGA